MVYIIVFLFLNPASVVFAKTSALKTNQQIHALCMERFPRIVDKRKTVCDCVVNNLTARSDSDELKFIYKFLESKKEPVKMNDEQTMLVEFSNDVSEKCINNPKWIVDKDEPLK